MKPRRGTLFLRAFRVAPRTATAVVFLLFASALLQTFSAYVFALAIGQVSSATPESTLLLLLAGAGALASVALCSWGLRPVWGSVATALTQASVSEALTAAEQTEQADDPIGSARSIEVAAATGSMRHREALGAVPEYLSARIRGMSGVVILGLVSPWIAALLAVGAIIYGRFFTAMLDDVLSSMNDAEEDSMRASYTRRLVFNRSLWGEFRVFDAHRWLVEYVARHSKTGRAKAARERSRYTSAVVITGTVLMVLYFAAFWWMTTGVLGGSLTIASLMLAFQGALLLLDLGPIGDVAVMYREAARVEARFGAGIPEGSTTAPGINGGKRNSADPSPGKVISVRELQFSYPGANDFTVRIQHLEIDRGERVAIVGRNGAGKSTLLGLIAGYIRGYEGTIDTASDLEVSVSLQTPARYPTTLRDNVELGRSTVDISHALKRLGGEYPWDGVSLDDELGSRSFDGKDFSGGQWQRVGLARAVAQARGILLLDEPSASLDPKAEAEFFRSIVSNPTWDAVLVTTHHLPNVRFVDRIIVLDQGRVVETGTHAQLLAAGGLYAELYATQASLYGVNVDG